LATEELGEQVQSIQAAAIDAAIAGGRVLREHFGKASVREKGPSDLVTDADLASQRTIEQVLHARFPNFAFLGEESTDEERQAAMATGRPLWVVDPLDGTANFVHRLLGFSVSIALIEDGQVAAGVVHDPMSGTLYSATADGQVMKDSRPIRASGCAKLGRAMVCCSFPPAVTRQDRSVAFFLNVLERSRSLRRLGSAALNLCYLAEGCLDSYWATSVKTWDIAAGYLIAASAGAVFTNTEGKPFDLWNPQLVASATPALQQEMLECLAEA
jgi:myo-inositol-1(or 4)-monophosphatase